MATSFAHSADIGGSLDDVTEAYSRQDYWTERIAAVGAPEDRLEAFSVDDAGTVEVTIVHSIPEKDIPAAARKVVGNSLTVTRTTVYGPRTPQRLEGSAHAEAAGGLAVIDGSGHAAATGEATCTEDLSGTVKVSIPLLGGKLEKTVVEYLQKLFAAEYRFLDEYVRRGHTAG